MSYCPSSLPDKHREPFFDGDYSFNTGGIKQFTFLDYVIFVAILAISAGIGFYFAWADRKKASITDFLLAGRSMNPLPVGLSLLASFMSAITLLGTPAEIYNFTFIYCWMGLAYFLTIAGAAHLYIPIFYNLRLTSAYEYLERRFSKGTRTSAAMAFVLQMILYMAIVLYAPSLALNAVTGFTLWGSVISVGVICTLYTAFGGMKAVLWTDSFQVTMMFVSLFAVLIKGAMAVGSWQDAWDSAERMNRIQFLDFNLKPGVRHTVWSLTIGGYFTWVAVFGCNQAQVQRASTCTTLKEAQFAMWMNFPGLCIILYLCIFIGMYMAAFYENCDPLRSSFVKNSNQLVPFFVMDVVGNVMGLPGLFVAGLFSGALSTISSGLNSISAVILEDVMRSYFKYDIRQGRARRMSQAFAILFGALCLVLTYVASKMESILQFALSLYGMISGPLLGLFSLGMFFPWANKWGAISGLFGSMALTVWIGVGGFIVNVPRTKALRCVNNCNLTAFPHWAVSALNSTPPIPEDDSDVPAYALYTTSYLWYSVIAFTTCIIVGLSVSFITGFTDPTSLDPRLICPLADHLFPFMFLPESVRKPLRFGIVHEKKYDLYASKFDIRDIRASRASRSLSRTSRASRSSRMSQQTRSSTVVRSSSQVRTSSQGLKDGPSQQQDSEVKRTSIIVPGVTVGHGFFTGPDGTAWETPV